MEQLAHIESQIKALWEKAQQAGDLIVRLREEKHELQTENTNLRQEIAALRSELSSREQHLQKVAAHAAKSSEIISNGEREALTARVKELLAKIDAYL